MNNTLNRLRMPPLLDTFKTGCLNLTAKEGQTKIFGDKISKTIGFNQGFLGPTILIKNGSLSTSIKNSLSEKITVHNHGLLVPGYLDGGPQSAVLPNCEKNFDLNIAQRPATLWYHSHVHKRTGNHIYFGLAGAIIHTDGLDDDRGLPTRYGIDDLTLIIQDRHFDDTGAMIYRPTISDVENGFHGEYILVNGQLETVAVVPKAIVRLRLINASNARIYSLGFSDGRPMHLIATDAGFIGKPVSLNHLRLIPGERAEVLVDFSGGFSPVLVNKRGNLMQVQKFIVDDTLSLSITCLPEIISVESFDLTKSINKTRNFSLTMGGGSAGQISKNVRGFDNLGDKYNDYSAADLINNFGINGHPYDMNRIDFEVALGTVERWIISGAGSIDHPFHVHGVHFKVISENGGLEHRSENIGWKDTVLVSGQTEILIRFENPAGRKTPFMYHCHILEHEDSGMMGQFSVI